MSTNLLLALVLVGAVAGCSDTEPPEVRHVVAVGDVRLVDAGDGCLDMVDSQNPGGGCWEAPDDALAVIARPSGGDGRSVLVAVAVTVPDVATVELRHDGAVTTGVSHRYSGAGRLFTLVVPVGTTGRVVALDDAGRSLASTETLHLHEWGTHATTVYPDL